MAELNYLTLNELESEKDKLVNDFNELKEKIIEVEKTSNTMKNNLNALSGAIQQSEKLIKIVSDKKGKNKK
jgi:archaellum component FlaC|tara:strand:+ start:365 stop:577 length:213 start_codon:yes stop_codon:yes gene_type:complete